MKVEKDRQDHLLQPSPCYQYHPQNHVLMHQLQPFLETPQGRWHQHSAFLATLRWLLNDERCWSCLAYLTHLVLSLTRLLKMSPGMECFMFIYAPKLICKHCFSTIKGMPLWMQMQGTGTGLPASNGAEEVRLIKCWEKGCRTSTESLRNLQYWE